MDNTFEIVILGSDEILQNSQIINRLHKSFNSTKEKNLNTFKNDNYLYFKLHHSQLKINLDLSQYLENILNQNIKINHQGTLILTIINADNWEDYLNNIYDYLDTLLEMFENEEKKVEYTFAILIDNMESINYDQQKYNQIRNKIYKEFIEYPEIIKKKRKFFNNLFFN